MKVLFFLSFFLSPLCFADSAPYLLVPGLRDESEFGAAIVSGNANTETYNAKQSTAYEFDKNVVRTSGHYLEARANGLESARNWDAVLRYERELSEVLNAFTDYGLESDIFAGYVQRNNFDLGGKYYFVKSIETTWFAEGGYRYSSTHYPASQPDINDNSARIYSEAIQAITQTAVFKLWAEYIQAIASSQSGTNGYSVAQDYQLNVEPSLSVMMNQIFSLKVAYQFRYKNYLPPGSTATKYLDTLFTTSLVAKF